METPLLETLVKLANLGAAGVCIFAIFWIGWLISRTPNDAVPERYLALRHFMLTTIAIAVITGVAGYMNARYQEADFVKLQTEVSDLEKTLETKEKDLQSYRDMRSKIQGVVQTVQRVVAAKELSAGATSPELARDVEVLKGSVSDLQAMLDSRP